MTILRRVFLYTYEKLAITGLKKQQQKMKLEKILSKHVAKKRDKCISLFSFCCFSWSFCSNDEILNRYGGLAKISL